MWVWFLETGAGIKNSVEQIWSSVDMKQIEKQEQYSGEYLKPVKQIQPYVQQELCRKVKSTAAGIGK